MRIKCATLPWHTLKAALRGAHEVYYEAAAAIITASVVAVLLVATLKVAVLAKGGFVGWPEDLVARRYTSSEFRDPAPRAALVV